MASHLKYGKVYLTIETVKPFHSEQDSESIFIEVDKTFVNKTKNVAIPVTLKWMEEFLLIQKFNMLELMCWPDEANCVTQ